MAGGGRFTSDEGDFVAVLFAKHADFVENAAAVKVHDQHLLLRCIRLEKRLTDPHLADVIPNAVIECGDAGWRAEYGANILLCRSPWANVFHRRGSKDMTVRRDFVGTRDEAEAETCSQRQSEHVSADQFWAGDV